MGPGTKSYTNRLCILLATPVVNDGGYGPIIRLGNTATPACLRECVCVCCSVVFMPEIKIYVHIYYTFNFQYI